MPIRHRYQWKKPDGERFLQVLDGRFRRFALMRVSFPSKGVLMRTQFTNSLVQLPAIQTASRANCDFILNAEVFASWIQDQGLVIGTLYLLTRSHLIASRK
jgi:hypothetical protein